MHPFLKKAGHAFAGANAEVLMNGTTLCPHCSTRFKISEAQLTAHHGMVRCGHCMQAFDARPSFIPDIPSPQLALPIDEPPDKADSPSPSEPDTAVEQQTMLDTGESGSLPDTLQPAVEAEDKLDFSVQGTPQPAEPDLHEAHYVEQQTMLDTGESGSLPDTLQPAVEAEDKLDFSVQDTPQPAEPDLHEAHYVEQLTLAEQVNVVEENEVETFVKPRTWPWAAGAIIAILLLVAQSTYFLRVDLAARIPAVKPALITYCKLLGCSVPYPQKSALISIESSSLDADPAHENQITLNALLRNHASFSQAFPSLSLTLNDNQDKPLARRLFTPSDYLTADENEKAGFRGNHEINIKLPLYTGELRPVGYQLEFFYSSKTASDIPPSTGLPREKK